MSDFQIPLLSTFVGFLADIMRVCLEFCYKFTNDMGFPSYGKKRNLSSPCAGISPIVKRMAIFMLVLLHGVR